MKLFIKSKSFCGANLEAVIFSYINKLDKRIIPDHLLFAFFLDTTFDYYREEEYFNFNYTWLVSKRKDLVIPKEFYGLKDYKKIWKIMSRIMLYEEEAAIWNEGLQKILSTFYDMLEKDAKLAKIILRKYSDKINNVNSNSIKVIS